MYIFRFGLGIAAETDICAACLEVEAVGAGRNFAVHVGSRQPYFKVVSSGTAEAQIAGAEADYPVRQAQKLQ